jgi:mono/diheme cytochrome c family protein
VLPIVSVSRTSRPAAVLALLACTLAVAGCGSKSGPPEGAEGETAGGNVELGAEVFQLNCATCHTLAAAGASGTDGTDFDKAKPDEATVEKGVRDTKIRGHETITLSEDQVLGVAAYVATIAGL